MSLITLSWVCGELQGRNVRFETRASDFLSCLRCHVSGRFGDNISACCIMYQTPRRKLKNMTHTCGGIFLTKFEVFGNVFKHCLEYLIYLLNRN